MNGSARPTLPKVTFGVIVLNGEPFTRYTLRALYPFAHEIIVVEGAVPSAAGVALANGHSSDGTLDVLYKFQSEEDPENKLVIVTAEDEGYANGFWLGEKHEQSQAYAKRATGNYLWQVDVDEFYQPKDMRIVLEMLKNDLTITAISFKQITFWGGFDYLVDGWYLRNGAEIFHRLFKWGPGYLYTTHRPPTVVDNTGRDLRSQNWITGYDLLKCGVLMYHYSLVFPKQVADKCNYYSQAEWAKRAEAMVWAQEVFMELRRPYEVHNVYEYPSWLDRYTGTHPPQIEALRRDLQTHVLNFALRPISDIETVLQSKGYRLGRFILQASLPFSPVIFWIYIRIKVLLQEPQITLKRWSGKISKRFHFLSRFTSSLK